MNCLGDKWILSRCGLSIEGSSKSSRYTLWSYLVTLYITSGCSLDASRSYTIIQHWRISQPYWTFWLLTITSKVQVLLLTLKHYFLCVVNKRVNTIWFSPKSTSLSKKSKQIAWVTSGLLMFCWLAAMDQWFLEV